MCSAPRIACGKNPTPDHWMAPVADRSVSALLSGELIASDYTQAIPSRKLVYQPPSPDYEGSRSEVHKNQGQFHQAVLSGNSSSLRVGAPLLILHHFVRVTLPIPLQYKQATFSWTCDHTTGSTPFPPHPGHVIKGSKATPTVRMPTRSRPPARAMLPRPKGRAHSLAIRPLGEVYPNLWHQTMDAK